MGEDMIAIGFVVGLDYHDASLSAHDLLQQFKTHPLIRPLLEGGERIGWGAKTIPEGGLLSVPDRLAMPGAVITGDSAGFVNVPKLKGVHYAMRSGMLAAETIYEQLKAGADPAAAGALQRLRPARARRATSGATCARCATCARRSTAACTWAAAWPAPWISPGARSPAAASPSSATPRRRCTVGPRDYPEPDGKLTFDKLSSVFLSGNRTRDDQPNHIRVRPSRAARGRPGVGGDVPRAGVRDRAATPGTAWWRSS